MLEGLVGLLLGRGKVLVLGGLHGGTSGQADMVLVLGTSAGQEYGAGHRRPGGTSAG